MKLNLRMAVAVACATSFATALIQMSACATGELQNSQDAAPDVIYKPRPTGTSDGGDSSAPTCTATPCVVNVAAGGAHTCAVIQDGTVRCWGSNYSGELGISPEGGIPDGSAGPIFQTSQPVQVAGAAGVVGVIGGGPFASGSYDYDVSCALTATAAPQCWGSNQYDMLGRGTPPDTIAHPDLAAVTTLTGSSFVSLGQTGACAVTSGALSCWGQNTYQQLGVLDGGFGSSTPVPITSLPAGKKAIQAALGYGHICTILDDQTVACWGYDFYGQCGIAAASGESQPTPNVVPGLTGATDLALGSYHSCALTTAGAVECWGYNYLGALGAGPSDGGYEAPTPLTVLLPAGRKATQIAAGEYTTCALLDDGTVACWGFNTYGQVGFIPDGALAVVDVPTVINGVTDAVQITMGAGSEHVCARLKTGGVKCWGANASGQLGAATSDAGTGLLESAIPLDVAF